MNKKTVKIISILLIFMLLLVCTTTVFAETANPVEGALSGLESQIKGPSDTGIQEKAGQIIGTIQWVGTILGVIIIACLGIKYMLGSMEEKAEYKKSLVPLLIGAVMLIAATQIGGFLFKFLGS